MVARFFAWRVPRRIVTIGAVFLGFFLLVALFPLLLMMALLADLVRSWSRKRWLRLLAMVSFYVGNEVVGILALFVLWVATGFGLGMHSERSYRWHGQIHGWWTNNLLWGAGAFLGATVDITNARAVAPAPVVMLARHISLLDAVVPSVLLTRAQWNAPRHVLMRGLRWEPCIDMLGHRTPNHFVDRASKNREGELEPIRVIGRSLNAHGSAVIFPEGGFRTPARFARIIERLRESDPEIAERAALLKHVSPPRPRGSQALIEAAPPEADIVLVAHRGFERFSTIRSMIENTPFTHPITVELKRIARADVPLADDEFFDWILGQYEWIDAWVDAQQQDVIVLDDPARMVG